MIAPSRIMNRLVRWENQVADCRPRGMARAGANDGRGGILPRRWNVGSPLEEDFFLPRGSNWLSASSIKLEGVVVLLVEFPGCRPHERHRVR